jgi:hypothetical protein
MSAAGERFWRIGQEMNIHCREQRSKGKGSRRSPSADAKNSAPTDRPSAAQLQSVKANKTPHATRRT